jgi:hypothetical protein
MLKTNDIRIERYASGVTSMPWAMRLTHIPSNLAVEGNCKMESGYEKLHETLSMALNQSVMKDWKAPPGQSLHEGDDAEKQYMQEQIREMQAKIDQLMAGNVPGQIIPPRRRGRPPKAAKRASSMSAEQRSAVGQRLKAAREAKRPPEPEPGRLTDEQVIANAMRPPTDRPVELPSRQSKGGVVVKVSDEALRQGFKP